MNYFLLLIGTGYCFEIFLRKYEKQCFGEDIRKDTLFIGEVDPIKSPSRKNSMTIIVTDNENNIKYNKITTDNEKFSFISTSNGPHVLCIENMLKTNLALEFSITTGLSNKEFTSLPSTKDIKESEKILEKIRNLIKEITQELQNEKSRQSELTNTTETIQSRVIIYSMITLALLLILASIQLVFLKSYFKLKKII